MSFTVFLFKWIRSLCLRSRRGTIKSNLRTHLILAWQQTSSNSSFITTHWFWCNNINFNKNLQRACYINLKFRDVNVFNILLLPWNPYKYKYRATFVWEQFMYIQYLKLQWLFTHGAELQTKSSYQSICSYRVIISVWGWLLYLILFWDFYSLCKYFVEHSYWNGHTLDCETTTKKEQTMWAERFKCTAP